MTRKINRSNGREYVYYYCPTGKKGGCKSSSMIKESELTECVQNSLKAHINSVVSLNSLITSISRERINQGLVQEYTGYIKSNEEQLTRVEKFKRNLYESLVSGALSKEEFLQYKQEYSTKAEEIKTAIQDWSDKLAEVLENRGERNRWLNHFLQFAEMEEIDRSVVSRLIQSIKISTDKQIEVRFNYQDEYQKAAAFIKQISEERRAG